MSATLTGELAVESLGFTYPGLRVLDGLSLSVRAGELAVITGPSGIGKTTVLHLIRGEEVPDAGTISVSGKVLAGPGIDLRPVKRPVALVPQGGGLDHRRNIGANLALGLPKRMRMLRAGAARVAEAFDLVGLANPMADRLPRELSVGERQRVALARGLVERPEVLLLDEPFFALDAHTRAELQDVLRDVLAASGTTTVMVTHDAASDVSIGDAVYTLRNGQLVAAN